MADVLAIMKKVIHPWEFLKNTPQIRELEAANDRMRGHLETKKNELEVNLGRFREALRIREKTGCQ